VQCEHLVERARLLGHENGKVYIFAEGVAMFCCSLWSDISRSLRSTGLH